MSWGIGGCLSSIDILKFFYRTCHPADGSPVTTQWIFSACLDGQYTCNDGHCISMEQRCNQLTDCKDKSDEIDCNMLVISSGYSKMVAPIKLAADKTLIPVTVDVSLQLLKIVEIEEENHAIDFQYEIMMAWKDHRVEFHNLKKDTSLNALREADIKRIWLPLVREGLRNPSHGNCPLIFSVSLSVHYGGEGGYAPSGRLP